MAGDKLVTPEQVAEHLQISPLTVVRWMRSGRLKAQKFGRKIWRMKAEDLETLMRSPVVKMYSTVERIEQDEEERNHFCHRCRHPFGEQEPRVSFHHPDDEHPDFPFYCESCARIRLQAQA